MQDQPVVHPKRPSTDDFVIGDEMSLRAKVLSTLLLLFLAVGSTVYVWLMSSLPRIEGIVPVAGLHLPATIARDPHGVPRITARSVRDAYFALGWVHAQDRIWQMELQRRVGAGRLAEAVGPPGLPNDRFMRTLGLYDLARQTFDRLDRPTRDSLGAYAEGVNAWIDSHRHRLPIEFSLLGVRPEAWTPADTLVWARLMALQLTNNWRDELLMARLAHQMDPGHIRELWPAYPSEAPVTLGSTGSAAGRVLAALPDAAEPRLASNVWAVAGSHTASGKPLLANDPHLGFQAPVLWYLASIEAPGLSLSGATVPGVPFHLIGHNGRIAWGTTTTHADTVDLFVETVTEDGKSYATPAGPVPFDLREEVIHVKGEPDEVLKVRTTRHGPVVSDLLGGGVAGDGKVIALRATALEPDDLTAQAIYHLNRAVDWKGFRTALGDFAAPVQNFAFADTIGTIAFLTAGRVPLRRSGDGAALGDGATGQGEWAGWVPFDRMPQMVNPRSGMVVNANNRVTPSSYRFTISSYWPEGYRARRITEMLTGRDGLTVEDMQAMQMDRLSLADLELKDLLTDAQPRSELGRQGMKMVAAWDGVTDPGRPEPLIFAAWVRELWKAVFADDLGGDFPSFAHTRPYVLRDALAVNRHWCDDKATPDPESCEDVAGRALDRAMADLAARHGAGPEAWRWDDEHKAVFANPILRHLPLIGRLTTTTIPTGGDDFTVDRGTFGSEGFEQVHGAGLRAVFDLSDLSHSRFILALGQSGNPLSRHRDDMVERWQVNDGLRVGVRQGESSVLTLEPGY